MWRVKVTSRAENGFTLEELWSTEEVDKKLQAFRELNAKKGTFDIIHIDDSFIFVDSPDADWEFYFYG